MEVNAAVSRPRGAARLVRRRAAAAHAHRAQFRGVIAHEFGHYAGGDRGPARDLADARGDRPDDREAQRRGRRRGWSKGPSGSRSTGTARGSCASPRRSSAGRSSRPTAAPSTAWPRRARRGAAAHRTLRARVRRVLGPRGRPGPAGRPAPAGRRGLRSFMAAKRSPRRRASSSARGERARRTLTTRTPRCRSGSRP